MGKAIRAASTYVVYFVAILASFALMTQLLSYWTVFPPLGLCLRLARPWPSARDPLLAKLDALDARIALLSNVTDARHHEDQRRLAARQSDVQQVMQAVEGLSATVSALESQQAKRLDDTALRNNVSNLVWRVQRLQEATTGTLNRHRNDVLRALGEINKKAGLIEQSINQLNDTCKARYDGPVYIALTTIPSRLSELKTYLVQLEKQTYPIHEVLLSVPYVFKRTGEPYPDPLPAYLTDGTLRRTRVIRGEDYGPATKFLMPLKEAQLDDKSALVVLDDDLTYSRHLVCDYVHVHRLFPDAALTRRGQTFNEVCDPSYLTERTFRASHDRKDPNFVVQQVHTINGVGSFFVQKRFFDDKVLSYEGCPPHLRSKVYLTDDLWASGYLAYRKVQRIAFSTRLANPDLEIHKAYQLRTGPEGLFILLNNQTDNNNVAARALALYWGCDPGYIRRTFSGEICDFDAQLPLQLIIKERGEQDDTHPQRNSNNHRPPLRLARRQHQVQRQQQQQEEPPADRHADVEADGGMADDGGEDERVDDVPIEGEGRRRGRGDGNSKGAQEGDTVRE
ncbi:unnamed protein product [Vitrella brassicaformis CCMP3155]|uniref:Uncharacterized protein n=1 Tax=Vitrella brassicaformis (strain CCMP3155) TaxID=1169540 RepID=A0A0G4EQS9_VITBC|nr:unnamed protein product [Vitrella brassicaformis CCMP3155]|eukprot:CEL99795.1 unnamed protein product [Vitrella brassicaformis CCMP3155]